VIARAELCEKKVSVFRFHEGKILRRPLLARQLRNNVVGLLRMTSAGVFVILRERSDRRIFDEGFQKKGFSVQGKMSF
jgi:hypothetical protein